VNINGYQNEITLTGSCNQVNVNGRQNTVHIEETAGIQVLGHTILSPGNVAGVFANQPCRFATG
jgi:hypothetical protein